MAYKGKIRYYLKERQRPYDVEYMEGHVEEGYGLPLDGCIIALHVAKVRHNTEINRLHRRVTALEKALAEITLTESPVQPQLVGGEG